MILALSYATITTRVSPVILGKEASVLRDYEALCVLKANLGDDKITALMTRFEKKIVESGGELVSIEKMGQKRLPFRLNKHKLEKEGFYVLIKFKGDGKASSVLKEDFRIQEDIIRSMVSRVQESPKIVIEEPEAAPIREEISGQPQ